MPNSAYWDLWTEAAVGISPGPTVHWLSWCCRWPVSATRKGFRSWNESRWVDAEFTALLLEAQGTLDVEARRAIMADIRKIQMDRGSVAIAWWMSSWAMFNPAFQTMKAHPTAYNLWREVWYDADKDSHA